MVPIAKAETKARSVLLPFVVGGAQKWYSSGPTVHREYLLALLGAQRLRDVHKCEGIAHGGSQAFYADLLAGEKRASHDDLEEGGVWLLPLAGKGAWATHPWAPSSPGIKCGFGKISANMQTLQGGNYRGGPSAIVLTAW